jgi:hypothetical protein
VAGAELSSDATCLPCPAGTFAPKYGSTGCLACPLGFYSSSTATKNCSSCWPDGAEPCNAIKSGKCFRRCSVLKFRANPDTTSGGYLCRYSRSQNAPEFLCTIPDPNFEQKLTCEYEKSLLCKFQQPRDSSGIMQLECHSST